MKADINKHRNRLAGEIFEEYAIEQFRKRNIFPKLGRTKQLDPELDALGIDLVQIKRDGEKFTYAVQCKNSSKSVDYAGILDRLKNVEKGIPVLFNRKTKNTPEGRFVTTGEYAVLYMEDFLDIIANLERYKKGYEEYSCYFDSIYPDEQEKLHKKLLALGL